MENTKQITVPVEFIRWLENMLFDLDTSSSEWNKYLVAFIDTLDEAQGPVYTGSEPKFTLEIVIRP